MSSLIPKYIVDLKSMKYLAVASMAAQQRLMAGRQKRDAEYVKVYPPVSSRQKPIMPTWGSFYNRRPAINSPWTKDTQSVTVNTVELSDLDIQRETSRANLILVQRMGELVQVEKEKVISEIQKSAVEMERMIAEKEKHQMDTQKLEIEKEMIEAKLISGTAKSLQD
ncbi:uncharacterized protein LOC106667155 [Cimex lectularius]|uniref:Uncharacterized protein n=1 Tax=Cimex lectularius TaxID=79782 RepID=A0A8I6TLT4_CIMLE|nr:uncharacterized protein LOC106667155 [Cimex lectularius]